MDERELAEQMAAPGRRDYRTSKREHPTNSDSVAVIDGVATMLAIAIEKMSPVANMECQCDALREQVQKLEERRDKHLHLIRQMSIESINPDEADELNGQIAALIAEVGTLRNRLRGVEAKIELKPFMIVEATFRPKIPETLKSGIERWIGHRGLWEVAWVQDEHEQFSGQYALHSYRHLSPTSEDIPLYPGIWAPEQDFEIHKAVDRGEEPE